MAHRADLWRRGSLLLVAATAGCAAILGGDQGIFDPDAGAGGDGDGSIAADGSGGSDASDSGGPDASGDARPPPSEGGSACRGEAGPVAVRIGSFCVDATEVTRTQYKAFLAAKAGDVSGQPASCAWNTTYVPTQGWPPAAGEGELPANYLDWCDARAYCAWAGKRLCGAIGGGANAFGDYIDATKSQWYAACSHAADGLHAYPYGNTFQPDTCNGRDNGGGTLLNAGSQPTCVGGYAGLFDLSGNVREWEDSCAAAEAGSPQQDPCHVRGGSADDDGGLLLCAHGATRTRVFASAKTGFRCCGN